MLVVAEAGDDGDVLGDLQGERGQEGREVHQRQGGAAHQGQLGHRVSGDFAACALPLDIYLVLT